MVSDNPLQQIADLAVERDKMLADYDAQFQRLYFQARMQGQIKSAIDMGLHSRKQIMKFTRAENEALGRAIRWGA